jgi:hypothetical protein
MVQIMESFNKLASCSCGQLIVKVSGEPVRIAMCHCTECQKRTGSVFGTQARFALKDVSVIGVSSKYSRTADSGNQLSFHFCATCGSTVYFENSSVPGFMGIPVGAFADETFPIPDFSMFERTMHSWVSPPLSVQSSR